MRAAKQIRRGATVLLGLVILTGCELTEVTTTAAEDVVVVDALLQRRDDRGVTPSTLTAFLHRTVQGEQGLNAAVPGANVRVIRANGSVLPLVPVQMDRCVVNTPVQGTGTCYEAAPSQVRAIDSGETITMVVTTAQGEEMEAVSVVPGAFRLLTTPDNSTCSVTPDTPLEVVWTPAAGAWAYINETTIRGLREALGIIAPEPLDLLGLSISASDTTIVFPNEFGIFDRGHLDQDLALALQKGLPAGARATVSIGAVDRNYVNWVRGGNFNPSGIVRVPSFRGDGTGFFGTGVVRTFEVVTSGGAPACATFGG